MIQNERASLTFFQKILLYLFSLITTAIQLFLWFTLFGFLFDLQWKYSPLIFLVVEIIGIDFVIFILSRSKPPEYKLTWCVLILLLPLPFCLLYTINAISKYRAQKKHDKVSEVLKTIRGIDESDKLQEVDPIAYSLVRAVQSSVYAPVSANTEFIFFDDPTKKLEDLLEEIKKAKKFIFIECFIIADGKLLNYLVPSLEDAGRRGVKVRILYDDLGCQGRISGKVLKRMIAIENCEINNYSPITLSPIVNNRDHRKIIAIDGEVAYCGGDNLADEYIHAVEKYGFWRDNCAKYRGHGAMTFAIAFAENWFHSSGKRLDFDKSTTQNILGNGFVMPFTDGPFLRGNPTYDLFLSMIGSAQKEVLISSPYFIIDETLKRALVTKAKSGIKIKLLMPGIPDKKSVYYVSRENYRDLLRAGAEIYEFTPGFNHAKNLIVDGKYAYIGTSNFDYRSLYLHFECGALIALDPEIQKMVVSFDEAVALSHKVEYETWKKRPFYQRLIAHSLNLFSPLF